ncbi:MAG: DegQ family serine endoprotease [Candidatus Sericytochromatia bacterium]|nr:DegQ family serine endoprotease [Candidatus Sericytochromatia bacterium]
MKKNKIALNLALFSTALSGVLVGALVVNKPTSTDIGASFAATEKYHQSVTERSQTATSKSDVADKLSQDFIKIAKDVRPTVVSIYSTKNIKQTARYHEFLDDPALKKFFNSPHGKKFQENNGGGLEEEQAPSKEQGLGSGVIIDKSGLILTNNHVIEGADDISVILNDKRKFKAKVIGADPKTDVAVIKLEKSSNLPVAIIGDSNKLSVGEWVLAIGNPLGLTSTVTSGIISAKGRADVGIADFEDFIQTDAAINPGNSGGALINLQGEVIGINTAIASKTGGYMGIGFAIPSNMAKKVMTDLIKSGKVTRGFLGIQIQNMTETLAKSLNVEDPNNGIVVGEVSPDSPAAKSGIQRYDVVLELNGVAVSDVNSFRNMIASDDPGQTIKLLLLRDGKKVNANIKLGSLDPSKTASNLNKPNQTNPHKNLKPALPDRKLGFELEELNPELLKRLGIPKKITGVIITSIASDSAASQAGVGRGDIIQEFNKNKIVTMIDFNKAVKSLKSGDSVLLKINRVGQPVLLAFTYP